MIQNRSIRRRILGMLLGVQLLGGLVPLADARLEDASDFVVHVEATGGEPCDPVHVHEQCVLCQHLAQLQLLGGAPAGVEAVLGAAAVLPPGADDRPAFATVTLERGRSPPLV